MSNIKRFPGKFKGAKAILFAHACECFADVAELMTGECNNAPDEYPIFSWLSPQQRLQLVHEVMVGLLCPDEPLPPETIQHYTTYLALVTMIRFHIQIEIEECGAHCKIGDDLLHGYDYDDTTDDRTTRQTPEEIEERIRNMNLISRQAEKNKEKIDRAQASTDKAQEGINTRPVEEFHVPAEADSQSNFLDSFQRASSTMSALFSGPPLSSEARRLNRRLTQAENSSFHLRRQADAALQEHTHEPLGWPLCNVNFDWRCQNIEKWAYAIDLLMISYHKVNITPSEQALVEGEIGELDYADRSKHARIHAIEKIVKDLRDSYDPVWKPDMMAVDQRVIVAVCSPGLRDFSPKHSAWATAFMASCKEEGVSSSQYGDYQKRLEIYRRMAPQYKEGLSTSYYGTNFTAEGIPANFKRNDPIRAMCHTRGWDCKWTPREELKLCSRCKIVSYCSRECQVKDWPDHKKHCKVLAELRKDKTKVSEIVKNF